MEAIIEVKYIYFKISIKKFYGGRGMNNSDWEILITLAQKRSITKAAEALFLAQPTLSYRLKRIEEEFGVSLFDRVPSGVALTPQGERLAAYAQDMTLRYRALRDDLSDMSPMFSGTLRLGVGSAFANADLPRLLRSFGQRYPAVTISLKTSRSSQAYRSLVEGEVDIAIVRGSPQWSEERHLLREEPMCLASKAPIPFQDLPRRPQILVPPSDTHTSNLRWWREHFSVPPLVLMEVDNMETGLRMAQQDLGWMLVPTLLLKNAPDLFRRPLTWKDGTPYIRQTWALCRSSVKRGRVAAAFLEFLIQAEREAESPG